MLASGNQVLERHGTIREFPNRAVMRGRDSHRVGVADHLTDHGARYAEVNGKSGGAPVFGVEPFLELHARSLTHLNERCQGFPQSTGLNIDSGMKEYRRARFKELLDGPFKGNRAAFSKATGLTNGRITQLLDPDEPFGDTAARRLIDRLGLPPGFFDPPSAGQAPSPAGMAIGATYDKMSPAQQDLFLKLLEASFGAPVEARPKELGHSDFMDIDLEHDDEAEDKDAHRRNR